jgi:autotransporter-associated beta strand protein
VKHQPSSSPRVAAVLLALATLSVSHVNAQTAKVWAVNFDDPFRLERFGISMTGSTRSVAAVMSSGARGTSEGTPSVTASEDNNELSAFLFANNAQLFNRNLSSRGLKQDRPTGPAAPLAVRTWDGGGANDNWDTVLNWDNNALPANTDDVVFGTAFTSGTSISLNGNRTVNSFTINTTIAFTISNNTLTLTSGTLTRNDVAGTENDHTIASAITLGANALWTINGAGNLIISGAIGDGVNTFGLTKEGTGTLVFSTSAMTYGGDTTINAGTLQISVNNALSGTGNVQIGSAGTLGIGGAGATINGLSGTGLVDHNVGGTDTLTVGNNNANGNFSGIIANSAGTLNLTKAGTGTQILSGSNTYTGSTAVGAGVLNIQNSTALGTTAGDTSVASGAALELQGGIAVGAAEDLTSLGGTGISNGGALRNVSGNNSWGGTITLADVAGTLRINSDSGTLTIGGNITEANGNQNDRILTFGGAGNVTVNGAIQGAGTNDVSLAKDGSGTLTLTNANTFPGTTTVNAGTLLANNATGSATSTGAVTVNNSGTVLGGTGTISGAVTVNANAKVQGGNGTTGTTLTLAGGLTLADNSIIQLALGPGGGTAHSTLARTGSGTWIFDSNQAFTFIDQGATTGTTYQNIITGIADPPSEGSWTITNSGWAGTFVYDGLGNIDLTLSAVPEPSTWIGGALAFGILGWSQRRRFARLIKQTAILSKS